MDGIALNVKQLHLGIFEEFFLGIFQEKLVERVLFEHLSAYYGNLHGVFLGIPQELFMKLILDSLDS